MKGKRYTTEQKIRILREAEQADATIIGVCHFPNCLTRFARCQLGNGCCNTPNADRQPRLRKAQCAEFEALCKWTEIEMRRRGCR